MSTLADRLMSFVVERYPFALPAVQQALRACDTSERSIDQLRPVFSQELARTLGDFAATDLPDTTPGVTAAARLQAARDELLAACDGFLAREAIAASLTDDERREILRGMVLTRAVDNRLKQFFLGSEIKYREVAFQGKGFRSLGQEAIYAAGIRLKRGQNWRDPVRGWQGDIVGPIIRDLGVALAMRPEAETVRMVLNAQMAKSGPPMDGRDLHIGDWEWGILPATAPLSISTLSIAGIAMAFARDGQGRVALSFIGEGGSSLGEWHEAINLCAARRLPAVFCIENNQTALSTSVSEQSAVRVFADKAAGYGIPGITIDGTDPDQVAAAFTWAADRARSGGGPALIELVSMRMSGHAHHDDMLFLGKEPPIAWEYPKLMPGAYADAGLYSFWATRDPIAVYANRLESAGIIEPSDLQRFKQEAQALVENEAQAVIAAPWPEPHHAGTRVYAGGPPQERADPLEPGPRLAIDLNPPLPREERRACRLIRKGHTFLDAIALGIADALRADPRVFVYGEDVGGRYGNSFLLLRPLLDEFGDRIINSPLAESGVLGVCVGAALAGQRPIGEMQFNDFVASGFNQLVNNAAKIRYRWGGSVPMVLRMPWGGLRHAGPVSLAEHRSLVLSNAGREDRGALDARGCTRAAGQRHRRPRSSAVLRAHRAVSGSRNQAGAPDRASRTASTWARRRFAAPATTSRSFRMAPTFTSRFERQRRLLLKESRPACSTCARCRRSIDIPSLPLPATAAAS